LRREPILVLSRRLGERLVIRHYPSGDEFEVVVADVSRTTVKVGIDGSEQVWVVRRKELIPEKPKTHGAGG
jgi:sRNA-binding carbon storage regulator CsrA